MSSNIRETRLEVEAIKRAVKEANPHLTRMNEGLRMYVALSRRVGITGPIMDVISLFQQIDIAARTATRSIMFLYAGMGPIGWVLGLGGLALSGLMIVDMMEVRRPRY